MPDSRPPAAPNSPAPVPGGLPAGAREILVVQEDHNLMAAWTRALTAAGFRVHGNETIDEALEEIMNEVDWIGMIVDVGFRGPEALSFLQKLPAIERDVPVLAIGWEASVAKAPLARQYAWFRFMSAPAQPASIAAAANTMPPPVPRVPKGKDATRNLIVHRPEGILRPLDPVKRSDMLPSALRDKEDAEKAQHDEKVAHELARAQEIQKRLLPSSFPQPPGWEIAGQYLPAEHVGGDYYDVITLPDGRIAMLVADVSGKGISAAMVMVMARTVFHSVAPGSRTARDLVIAAGDRIANDLPGGIFVSLVAAILDPVTAEVSVVNCGHMPPMQWSVFDGQPFVSQIDVSGGAIGLVKGSLFARTLRDATVVLQPGESLTFYTDGVNEAMDEKNEEFGDKRLHKAVKKNGHEPAEELVQSIVDSVLYHRGDAPASDDLTVLVVRRVE
jgi:serine phosphatase RsbU (regulator of sigma subunit)